MALAPGVTDVSHEFNCTFDASTGAQARVWVFAEPVTTAVGRSIVQEARREPGCAVRPDAPTFGTPSVGTLCRTGSPASRAVTLRGLFGDAWLSCRLSTPGASSADRDGTAGGPVVRAGGHHPGRTPLRAHAPATASAPRRQRMPASRNGSMSPSKTACGLPVSYSVRRSLTSW